MDAIFDEALESPLERGFQDVRAGHQQEAGSLALLTTVFLESRIFIRRKAHIRNNKGWRKNSRSSGIG